MQDYNHLRFNIIQLFHKTDYIYIYMFWCYRYLAPEWQKNSPISLKVDIFSYGIVLLEIICCRRNLETQVSNVEEIVLSSWVYKCFERGQLDVLVGHHEQVDKETLERLVKVGLWCIQDEPAHRPSIKCVLLMLEGITDLATPPCPTTTW